ncbi:MAG TPA: tripartite tricarboxylate transporter TctB family protein [bacterium]|nr:tripartite tricarboxylate transporter TctB family protein [bacterium]
MNQTDVRNQTDSRSHAMPPEETPRVDLWADVLIGGCMAMASMGIFIASGNYARENMPVSPEVYPRLLAGLLGPLGLYLLGRSVRRLKHSPEPAGRRKRIWPVIATVFLALVAYVAVMTMAGYVVSTMAYLVFMMRYLGERRLGLIAVWVLGVTLGLYFSFQQILGVPLPRGWLGS